MIELLGRDTSAGETPPEHEYRVGQVGNDTRNLYMLLALCLQYEDGKQAIADRVTKLFEVIPSIYWRNNAPRSAVLLDALDAIGVDHAI